MVGKILLFLLVGGTGVLANWIRLRATINGYRRRPSSE